MILIHKNFWIYFKFKELIKIGWKTSQHEGPYMETHMILVWLLEYCQPSNQLYLGFS